MSPRRPPCWLLLAAALALLAGPVGAQSTDPVVATPTPEPTALVAELVKAVMEKNEPKRNQVFIKLRMVGKDATPALLARLDDGNVEVASYVAFTLGWVGDERVVKPLIAMVEGTDPDRQRAAMKALGNLRAKEALPALKAKLSAEQREVRRDAVYSLGLVRDAAALPWLEPLTTDADDIVAFFAKEAIERIKTGW